MREMVDEEAPVSETTVRPLERVVTEALLAEAATGDVDGRPGNSSDGVNMAENSRIPCFFR